MNTLMTESALVEQSSLRDKLIERIEVLSKVKQLFLIPEIEGATTKMVAEYFEVPHKIVEMCYLRNKAEIDPDGVGNKKLSEIKGLRCLQDVGIVQERAKAIINLDGFTLEVPNTGIKVFPKRAILHIAMLLRDSAVAKEIRTQLLNTFEHATSEQRTKELVFEDSLLLEIGKAYASKDIEAFAHASMKHLDYLNRHIEKISGENEKLAIDNKILADGILAWTNRTSLNKAVRVLTGKSRRPYGEVFKDLYEELRYKHGMGQRGKPPLIQHIREDEWQNVIQSFAALCENRGVSPTEVLEAAKLV